MGRSNPNEFEDDYTDKSHSFYNPLGEGQLG